MRRFVASVLGVGLVLWVVVQARAWADDRVDITAMPKRSEGSDLSGQRRHGRSTAAGVRCKARPSERGGVARATGIYFRCEAHREAKPSGGEMAIATPHN